MIQKAPLDIYSF